MDVPREFFLVFSIEKSLLLFKKWKPSVNIPVYIVLQSVKWI